MRTRQDAIDFVNKITDSLGLPLDKEIKKPVAALYLLGIKTTSSCQGHINKGHNYPWIDIDDSFLNTSFLEKELPSFHLMKKGFAEKSSLRLAPKRVKDITDDCRGDFSQELKELNNWAKNKLG